MNSVGKILKNKREELQKTLTELANETKISKRYLEAIENDNYEEFPGEAYYLGFLKTYSKSLGLNPDELIELYKRLKLIEEPIPMEELTKPLTNNKLLNIKYISIIAGILIVILFFSLFIFINNKTKKIASNTNEEKISKTVSKKPTNQEDEKFKNFFKFSDKKIIKELLPQEGISIIYPNLVSLHFLYKDININERKITLYFYETNTEYIISEGEEIYFSFSNNNDSNDLLIKLESFSRNNPQIIYLTIEKISDNLPDLNNIVANQVTSSKNEQNSSEQNQSILPKSSDTNINVEIKSRKSCYIKYIVDNNETKEQILTPNNPLRIFGKNIIEIHITHLPFVSIIINSKEIQLPKSFNGFLIIKYIYDETSKEYKITYEFKE
ncbi:MAG: helix-turn-helix domain-containing protein [Spirochaetes bacterium]|nr:helix-turn-helix domain-containing protein [Spirochaetota bacterium]